MARLLSVIIETRLKEKELKNVKIAVTRINNLLLGLIQNKEDKSYFLNGNRISIVVCDGIWNEIDNPCIVPDFNHNGKCECKNQEPFGVLRLFKADIVVDGYPEFDEVIGIWKLDKDTHLIISGIVLGTSQLTRHIDLVRLSN
jgi:hypothetical protein